MSLINELHRLNPTERKFGAGTYLFHQGDHVSVLHFVAEGEAHLIRSQIGGTALILQRAGPGAILAEASLFSERYHCAAIAVTPVRILAIRKSSVRARLAEEPKFAEIFAAHLALEVQATRLRTEILSLGTVSERLDAWITSQNGHLPPRGTWKTIANEIGTSAEALYRELAKRRRP